MWVTFLEHPRFDRYTGERHKKQRKMLNPAFSVAQMRVITQVLYETAHTVSNVTSDVAVHKLNSCFESFKKLSSEIFTLLAKNWTFLAGYIEALLIP